jgi:hypothetical protein
MGLLVAETTRVKLCFSPSALKVSCSGFTVTVMSSGEIIEAEYVELANPTFVTVLLKLVVRVGIDEEFLRTAENEG